VADGQWRGALAAAACAILAASPAWGTTVYVTSVGYGDVQLIINGQNVRSLRIGEESPEGVKLTDVQNGVAVLEIDGRPMSLRIGQSTVTQTILTADAQGHFIAAARINGVPVRALIDTGATFVSLNVADAQRMGVNYLQGKRGVTQTANGPATVYLVNLAHVQVGNIAFSNVTGSVAVNATAQQTPVLIGMSFLRLVEMRRAGGTMTLMRADR
jgi:aspartyl protease family protein